MKYSPHDYQAFATNFILTHPVAAILLDMGLGKTVIALSAMHELLKNDIHKILVIAPKRVAVSTWPAEIAKWDFLSDLTYQVVVGTETQRRRALQQDAQLYIINRENTTWLVEKSGVPFDFDMVCIDELSSFKAITKRFKSLLKVRPEIKRIIGLTGTPSSNGLMDLWAEFRLLDCGQRLGRYITQYRTRWFLPDKRNAQVIFSYKPRPGAEEEIYEAISDITISMKSVDYLDMPDRIDAVTEVEMSDKEWKVYSDLQTEMVVELGEEEIDAMNAAVLSNKLVQLSAGAVYTEDKHTIKVHDKKLDALEELIEAACGQPVLVAYWYKHDKARILERFPEARELSTVKDIDDWNAGKIPIALVHPMSAGHGLNLQQGGHIIIWFTMTWSLELYQQTVGRLYRQGQKNGTVTIQHIVTKGTIDEAILTALQKKERTQDALIDAVKAIVRGGGAYGKADNKSV